MEAIKLYDIGTGHVETLAERDTVEEAKAFLNGYVSQDKETNHVVYIDHEELADR